MKFVELNGVKIEYNDTGETNNPVLLFIHGAGGSASQFEQQHLFFSENFRVISVSLRGHGGSTGPLPPSKEAYTLKGVTRDIECFLDDLDINGVHLIGNSAGGVVGYQLISQRPDLVRTLVTFGTTGRMAFPQFLRDFTFWYDQRTVKGDYEKKLKRVAAYVSKQDRVREQVYQMFLQARNSIPFFRYQLGAYDYLPLIKNLACPYFLIRGELDTDINFTLKGTIKAIKEQGELTGNPSKVIELPGAGHIANLDNPSGFNECIAGILLQMS